MLKARKTGRYFSSKVIYRKEEYSFDTKPIVNTDLDLMVGNLFLSFDSKTMTAKQIWGYNPFNSWVRKKLLPPSSFLGELFLVETSIDPGISERIPGSELWATYFDEESDWICIGDHSFHANDIAVNFLMNAIAVIYQNQLKALWIKPRFE